MQLSLMKEYFSAQKKIIPLYNIVDNKCSCSIKECKNTGKHPKTNNWSKSEPLSRDEIRTHIKNEEFKTGFGVVLDKNDLVIDVDPRNGGFESLKKLEKQLGFDLEDFCQFIVDTGGSGVHFYFKIPGDIKISKHLSDFPGIDFKAHGGFVVGAGSLHLSGERYEVRRADMHPNQIGPLPFGLVKMLSYTPSTLIKSSQSETSLEEVSNILSFIPNTPEHDYDAWIRIGMSIHAATNGNGFDLWDKWSEETNSYKYDHELNITKWHSFGKNLKGPMVTLGTLIYEARKYGFEPNTDNYEEDFTTIDQEYLDILTDDDIDLKSPPGISGEIVNHINDNCMYPRTWITVSAAIHTLADIIGQSIKDELDNRCNIMVINIAGSATGKDAVLNTSNEIMRRLGLTKYIFPWIKSDAEIVKNIFTEQLNSYRIDEFGVLFSKFMDNNKNTPHYYTGVISKIMDLFTKSHTIYFMGGGDRNERIQFIEDQLDSDKISSHKRTMLKLQLEKFKSGVQYPFFSMVGYSTPVTFDKLITPDSVKNGFFGRCLYFKEFENNPRANEHFEGKKKIDNDLLDRLILMRGEKHLNEFFNSPKEPVMIPDDEETKIFYKKCSEFFLDLADRYKIYELEPIYRRAYQNVRKIALILSAEEGHITLDNARYAFKLVRRDLNYKKLICMQNEVGNNHAVKARIIESCSGDNGERKSILYRKLAKMCDKHKADKVIEELIKKGMIEIVSHKPRVGRPSIRYVAVTKEKY